MIQNIFIKNLLIGLLLLNISCSGTKEEEDYNNSPSNVDVTEALSCLRWIDRDLYFANQDPLISNRNNAFHVQQAIDIIRNLESNTRLGSDYFRINQLSPEVLDPIRPNNLSESEYKSFILIWEDSLFDQFVNDNLGGLSNIPDKNAFSIINPNFQRKYYMIIRSSCFEASSTCSAPDNDRISFQGLSALIARQIGFLFRLPQADCSTDRNNVMCVQPSDDQWSEDERTEFFDTLTNQMLVIQNNPNFYNDINKSFNCLTRPFMDQKIEVACPNDDNNNPFDVQFVVDTLSEIGCSSLLGCDYFDEEYALNECIPENEVPLPLELVESETPNKSYLMLWEDSIFNSFIFDNELTVPDPNSLLRINAAKKSNFTLIFRNSCFNTFDPLCDSGGSGGISADGTKALIARQFGSMVGVPFKDCNEFPDDVMCADNPSNFQWRNSFRCKERPNYAECLEVRDQCLQQNSVDTCIKEDGTGLAQEYTVITNSRNKFFNEFNNALEVIGNFPDFYNQFFEENSDDLENL